MGASQDVSGCYIVKSSLQRMSKLLPVWRVVLSICIGMEELTGLSSHLGCQTGLSSPAFLPNGTVGKALVISPCFFRFIINFSAL